VKIKIELIRLSFTRSLQHHYDLMGKALLQTFATVLGEGFTPEAKNAWKSMYGFMAEAMMEGEANAW